MTINPYTWSRISRGKEAKVVEVCLLPSLTWDMIEYKADSGLEVMGEDYQ